jgi:hypothetical protein
VRATTWTFLSEAGGDRLAWMCLVFFSLTQVPTEQHHSFSLACLGELDWTSACLWPHSSLRVDQSHDLILSKF